jgi:hypothetical protein
MSIVELVPVAGDEQDLEIVQACKDGASVARVAKQFGLSKHEVNAALDRALPKIDGAYKRRAIALSALRLDELTEVFHKQAKTGDIEAGNLCVRFEAERRALLGFTGGNYDPAQLLAIADQSQAGSPQAYEQVLQRLGKLPSSEPEPSSD